MDKKIFNPKLFLRTLTTRPGIYRMLDNKGQVIYVGKARNLKKRVASYFTTGQQQSPKTRVMMQNVADVQVTITHTEKEALLLENNLIKKLHPRYNIWFRDDKSYPYIYLAMDHTYPRLTYYRGSRKGRGCYFGPYPSAGAAKKTLNLIQKLFQIRPCKDSFFRNRSRPCLQYQIKRCSAPCVDLISTQDYQLDVKHAVMFLEGRNEEVIKNLLEPMQQAAAKLDYERAAQYRDQISNLRTVQEHQYVSGRKGDYDIIACSIRNAASCVLVMFTRNGLNLGSKAWFPGQADIADESDIISAFLPQFYLDEKQQRDIPGEILLSHAPDDLELLQSALNQKAGKKIAVRYRLRGEKAKWLRMATENAEVMLKQELATTMNQQQRLEALQVLLKIQDRIERIECFDISHIQGEATVAACVVFGPEGAVNSDYRRFNIEGIKGGDDYAAMEQALLRRYTRVKREDGKLPELLLIDGGKGQVASAKKIMEELQLADIALIGVAKGPARKAGQETLVLANENRTIRLPGHSTALHLIQNIRDEAHRFAITGHRQRRRKTRSRSSLEEIEGVGNKRRQNLIRHFGGIQGIARAGVDDLAMVPGINKNLAQKIYDTFH